jgi:hypothetical protein
MANPFSSPAPAFTPQVYAPIFCAIDQEPQSEIHQIEINMESNATDVKTIMRQWAGVVMGAAQIDFTLHAVIPFNATDAGSGGGLDSTGSSAAGVPLINTMVTAINSNPKPVTFAFGIGGFTQGVQSTQLIAKGFIKRAAISYSINGTPEIVYSGTAQFSFWTP